MEQRIYLTPELANLLKRTRQRAGTDQYTLAALAGLSRSMVKRLELGEHHSASVEDFRNHLLALAAHLQPTDLALPVSYMNGPDSPTLIRDFLSTAEAEEISSGTTGEAFSLTDLAPLDLSSPKGNEMKHTQPKRDPWDCIEEIHSFLQSRGAEGVPFSEIQSSLNLSLGSPAKRSLLEILVRLGASQASGVWALPPTTEGRISPEDKKRMEVQVRSYVRGQGHGIMTSREVAQACKIRQDHARQILQNLVSEGVLRSRNIKRGSFYYRAAGSAV